MEVAGGQTGGPALTLALIMLTQGCRSLRAGHDCKQSHRCTWALGRMFANVRSDGEGEEVYPLCPVRRPQFQQSWRSWRPIMRGGRADWKFA